MEEIAKQFCEELQSLLNKYKTQLSISHIMFITQDIFRKTLSIKDNPGATFNNNSNQLLFTEYRI